MNNNIENTFLKSWESWDDYGQLDMSFGACTLKADWFPKGFAQDGQKATIVQMCLNGEYSKPCVEVFLDEESLDNDTGHKFEVELVRSEELANLKSQLAKFKALVSDIDNSLPSGLDSYLTQSQQESYYERGEL
ncbi:hypothetical protein NCTGTJJY_CDS0070 [Serratia phage 92A1]|nr:hypothetical protein NCTGTJJY_CDS0070 [Serratia phage 92A1]